MDSVGVRIQNLATKWQVLTLARIAQGRSDDGRFSVAALTALFENIGLPQPGDTYATLRDLVRDKMLVRQGSGRNATYRLTPVGTARANDLASDMDLAALVAEGDTGDLPNLGATGHPVIPPSLAPPDLVGPLHAFFERYPFETNVFGMTRFPDDDEEKGPDPVAAALDVARAVCAEHGLTFHLASDRQIVDDLWPNVAAHIWGCKYAIAFFEDRRGRGINYNLSIEVGSTIVIGRRVAILKDRTIDEGQEVERLPTDLTGRIYKPVDLDDPATVRDALATWIKEDLAL
ncbi:MAG TPA: hypothetical protein VHI71_06495 [Actinomycetota bacterium]|nr:hypothetical protein [Actinomycetota bacterium]